LEARDGKRIGNQGRRRRGRGRPKFVVVLSGDGGCADEGEGGGGGVLPCLAVFDSSSSRIYLVRRSQRAIKSHYLGRPVHFLKYFVGDPSHQIFRLIYRALNVGKKITNYTVCL
jgi:hypothetical protein